LFFSQPSAVFTVLQFLIPYTVMFWKFNLRQIGRQT
jgi:hypothetical protein